MSMSKAAARPKSISKAQRYDVHPSVSMVVKWVAELKDKTGRTMDEWIAFIRKSGLKDEKACRDWLKQEHGMGTNSAWWLAEKAFGDTGTFEDSPEAYLKAASVYVEEMYSGPKAGLRPIHDALITLGRSLGTDVKVCPCKTIVPMFRNHVIAQIKPSTRTRIDFGLALGPLLAAGKTRFPERLIDTGGYAKKDRITHRFALASADEVDAEVEKWLRQAYELDGKAR
jgi:hypothetical protein